jgi:hypothetical protein
MTPPHRSAGSQVIEDALYASSAPALGKLAKEGVKVAPRIGDCDRLRRVVSRMHQRVTIIPDGVNSPSHVLGDGAAATDASDSVDQIVRSGYRGR